MTAATAPSSSSDASSALSETPGEDSPATAAGPCSGEEASNRDGAEQDSAPTGRRARLRWLVAPAIVLLAIVVVRALFVAPFAIPSGSMEPTLQVGDRILVSRLGAPQDLRRGDVVVFDASRAFNLAEDDSGLLRRVGDAVGSIVGLGSDTDYVKRVIGLPGDHVRCCSLDGRLVVNGVTVDEPYLYPGDASSATTFDVTLPADRYWVMGDHRSASADSRSQLGAPGGGMVPGEDIIGQVWVRYWPPGRIGTLSQVPLSAIPRNGH